jgi:two-component system OmpR family response regulator
MCVRNPQRPRVLIVDDEPDIVEFVANILRPAGCEVRSASDGDQALAEAESFRPDLALLDVVIPVQDGWLVCSKLKLLKPAPVIILVTGPPEEENDRFAAFVHADGLLRKPFTEEDVLRVLNMLPPAK